MLPSYFKVTLSFSIVLHLENSLEKIFQSLVNETENDQKNKYPRGKGNEKEGKGVIGNVFGCFQFIFQGLFRTTEIRNDGHDGKENCRNDYAS